MKKYFPDFAELGIVESFCYACQIVPTIYNFDVSDFFKKILSTDCFDNYFDDFTVFTQAQTYIIDRFLDELKEKNIYVQKKEYKDYGEYAYYREVAFWGAYLFLVWHKQENISGRTIVETYDIDSILDAYITLHTTSIAYAVCEIKENMKLSDKEAGDDQSI